MPYRRGAHRDTWQGHLAAEHPESEGATFSFSNTAIAIRTSSAVTVAYALDQIVPQPASALD